MNFDKLIDWAVSIPIDELNDLLSSKFNLPNIQFTLTQDVEVEKIYKPEDITVQINTPDFQNRNVFLNSLFSALNLYTDTPVHYDLIQNTPYIEDYFYLSGESQFGNVDKKFILFRYDNINGWFLKLVDA